MGRNSLVSDATWLQALLELPSHKLVHNVETELAQVSCAGHQLPITVNYTEWDNSYVCSPYTAFISYATEELVKLQSPALEGALKHFIRWLGSVLRSGDINRVVHINNWLLSTNLYPDWNGEGADELHHQLRGDHPDHVLVFRSLNPVTNANLMSCLQDLGYRLLPSRQVYLFDARHGKLRKPKNVHYDHALLHRRTEYERVEHQQLQKSDFPRIVDLYNQLYLEKYSQHNPSFSLELIRLWHQSGALKMTGLRHPNGHLDGIVGLWEKNGVTTVPLVGYEMSVPQKQGLYRMLMAVAIEDAHHRQILLNLSAGASHFKRLRGGKAELEFSAVYYRHLPWRKRLIWALLDGVLSHLAAPLMRHFKV